MMICSYLKPVLMGEFQTEILQPFFPEGTTLPGTEGGTAVSNLAHARLCRGMPTDVITLDAKAIIPIQCFRSELVNLWVVRRRPSKCIRDGYREERRLIAQALAESDADICHAHWTYEYGLSAVLQDIKPYIVTVHDQSLNILRWVGISYIGQYLITQYVLRKAAGLLTAVSPYIADYVSHITKSAVPVVPNLVPALGIGHEVLGVRGEGMFTVLTAADAGRLKNVKRAIRAFQLFRGGRSGCNYQLVGSGLGPDGIIAQWAESKGLSEGIDFRGWVPHAEVLRMTRSVSVILHPSLEESFGNPVAEAMALGVPVIGASEAGGVRWLLNNECGWLVRGKSVSELADALSEAADDEMLSQKKCKIANQRIKMLCNSDEILERYEQVYQRAMS